MGKSSSKLKQRRSQSKNYKHLKFLKIIEKYKIKSLQNINMCKGIGSYL